MHTKSTLLLFGLLAWLGLGGLTAAAQCPTPTCSPGTATNSSAPFVSPGIYNVRLGTANFASTGFAEGYRDSSCRQGISAIAGSSVGIQVTVGTTLTENVRVWLDINNNGIFDSTGPTSELVFSSNSAFVHTGSFTLPTSALLNQRLRLRVATDADISALPTPCRTPEYGQTKDFYIIATTSQVPPVAAFFSPDTVTCSGSVRFTDQSTGGPSQWRWDFGDGNTSALQNPTHFYAQAGTYSVKLVVRNANGADSLLRSNYVRFNDTVPVAACTTVNTVAYCCNFGITRATIRPLIGTGPAALDNASANGAAGYENFTCQVRVRLVEGLRYRVNLATNPTQPQDTRAWLDLNGNGTFEASEVIFERLNSINPADTFLLPAPTGAGVGRPIRLRIVSDGTGTPLGACRAPQLGQVEDYTVLVVPNTLPPVAAFVRSAGSNCDSTYTFRSISENAITQYRWHFGDGSIDTTSGATATHSYTAPGNYNVSLVVVGPYGRDTAVVVNAVTYVQAPIASACGNPATIQTCCNIGITNVRFGTINVTSGDATEGYQDFTCQGSTTLTAAIPNAIIVTVGTQQPESIRVWIDTNNDGNFDATELFFAENNVRGQRTGSITLPNTAITGVPLRMRILSARQQTESPCAGVNFGQVEDYSVVVLANTAPPTAQFTAINRTACDGRIQFANTSINADRYLWSFGDGNTDTTAAPEHTYANAGTYTVTLVVQNRFGADTLVRAGYITILPNLNLPAAPCQPVAQQTFNGFGIARVRFGTIDHATPSNDGYQDYTCTQVITLPIDTTLQITVNVAGSQGGGPTESVAIWIDYNANGQFDANELVGNGQATGGQYTTTVRFPGSAVGNRGLRMRVMSDITQGPGGGTALTPCRNLNVGQVEDYAVILRAVVQSPPVAGFSATGRVGCTGLVQFLDSSTRVPTRWLWNFGDGNTDTTASPSHQYTTAGTFTVTLIVSNSAGSDTLVRPNYINFTPLQGLAAVSCLPTFTGGQTLGFLRITIRNAVVLNQAAAPGRHLDLSCTAPVTTVDAGDSVTIVATTPQIQGPAAGITAWLDLNADGTFDATEAVVARFTRQGNTTSYTGKFLMPATATLNTPLRLRLMVLAQQGGSTWQPCATNTAGQSVDLALRVQVSAPVAGFVAFQANGCGSTVQLRSTSTGGPTQFTWDVGGTTYNTPIVSHNFGSPGIYTVTLIVSNALGADTTSDTVRIYAAPPAAACMPTPQSENGVLLTQEGMTRVSILNEATRQQVVSNTAPAGNDGIIDRTCNLSVRAARDQRIAIAVTAPPLQQQVARVVEVYLDLNNDGNLDAAELMVTGTGSFQQPNATTLRFNVPADAADGLLRLRVIEYRQGSTAPNCSNVFNGQAEDYGLQVDQTVQAKAQAAVAALTANLMPNPAANQVRLTATLPTAQAATLVLVDATGRTLLARSFATAQVDESLDLSALPAGVYQAVLQQGSQRVLKRLVVAR